MIPAFATPSLLSLMAATSRTSFAIALIALLLEGALAYNVAVFCSTSTLESCTHSGSTNPFVKSYFDAVNGSKQLGDLVVWIAAPFEDLGAANVRNVSEALVRLSINHVVVSTPGARLLGHVVDRLLTIPYLLLVTIVDPIEDMPSSLRNISQIVFVRDDEVGYLAGIVAGTHTTTGQVGICAGRSLLALRNIRSGFNEGVLKVCPTCVIHGVYLPSFSLSKPAINAAHKMVAMGADVIFVPAGSVGSETLRNITASTPAFGIGIDVDEFFTTFSGIVDSKSEKLLTSALKRTDVGVLTSVREGRFGTFKPGTRVMGVVERAVDLAPCHASCERISVKTKGLIDFAVSRARSGETRTNVDASTGRVLRRRLTFPQAQAQSLQADTAVSLVHVLGRVVFVDGNWERVSFYDPIGSIIESTTTGQAVGAALPSLRGGIAAVGVSLPFDFVLISGGVQNGTVGMGLFAMFWTDCYVECSTNPRWFPVRQTGATRPAPRQHHAMASVRNGVLLTGGMAADGSTLSDAWLGTISYNETTQTFSVSWVELPRMSSGRRGHRAALWTLPSNTSRSDTAAAVYESLGLRYLIVAGGITTDPSAPTVELLSLQNRTWMTRESTARSGGGASSAATERGEAPSFVKHPCILAEAGSWHVTLLSANTSISVNLATGEETRFATPTAAAADSANATTLPLWPAEVLDTASCVVIPAAAQTLIARVGPVGADAQRHTIYVIDRHVTSTNSLRVVEIPSIACDENLLLYRSDDLQQCRQCTERVEDGECPPRGDDDSDVDMLLYTIIPVVFVLGTMIGGLAWYWLLSSGEGPMARAPKKGMMGIGFIALVDTSTHWRSSPQKMGSAVERFRALVSAAAKKYGACEVRHIADAHLLVAHSPAELIRVCREVLTEVATIEWNGRPLTCRAAVHYGAPNVQFSEASGYDYVGADVDNLLAFQRMFSGSKLLISAEALEQTNVEELELPDMAFKTVMIKDGIHAAPAHIKVFFTSNITHTAASHGAFSPVIGGSGALEARKEASTTSGVALLASGAAAYGRSTASATMANNSSSSSGGGANGSRGAASVAMEVPDPHGLLTDEALAEHPHVVMGIVSAAECRRIARVIVDTLTALTSPMSTQEQLAFRRSCMTHMRTVDDDMVRLALAVLQHMDLLELRTLLEQFYNLNRAY